MDLSTLWWILGAALAIPAILAALIATAGYRSTMGMASGGMRMELLEQSELAAHAERIAPHDAWAEAHGFEWLGAYGVTIPSNVPSTVVIWTRPGAGEYFALYIVLSAAATDRVTIYATDRSLTTSSSADGMFYPPMPDHPTQAFPGLTLDELWARHQEAANFLEGRGWRCREDPRPIDEIIAEAVRRQAEFVRGHAAWPVRIVWWYMTRKQRTGVPIAAQRTAGMAQGWNW